MNKSFETSSTDDLTIRFTCAVNYLIEAGHVKNASEVARVTGSVKSFLTDIKKGRSRVGLIPVQRLCKNFPMINPAWMLLGKGPMVSWQFDNDIENEVVNSEQKDRSEEMAYHMSMIAHHAKMITNLNS